MCLIVKSILPIVLEAIAQKISQFLAIQQSAYKHLKPRFPNGVLCLVCKKGVVHFNCQAVSLQESLSQPLRLGEFVVEEISEGI